MYSVQCAVCMPCSNVSRIKDRGNSGTEFIEFELNYLLPTVKIWITDLNLKIKKVVEPAVSSSNSLNSVPFSFH